MKNPLRKMFRRQDDAREVKAASGFIAVAHEAAAHWRGRSYRGLSEQGYQRNPVAYRAVRMVAEASAAVPLLLYDGDEEIAEHPALSLLARPNGQMAGADFLQALYGHLMRSGNAYVEAARIDAEPRELHLLRPDRVRILEDRDGWPEGYEYRIGGRGRRFAAGEGGILHLGV